MIMKQKLDMGDVTSIIIFFLVIVPAVFFLTLFLCLRKVNILPSLGQFLASMVDWWFGGFATDNIFFMAQPWRRNLDSFEIAENPPWVRSSSTRLMIQEIKIIKESCGPTSTPGSATAQEQDWWAYASSEANDPTDQRKLEERSRNICNAIKVLQDYRSDMNEQKDNVNTSTVRMLTPDILCDVNRKLVQSRYPQDAGKFREKNVETLRPNNECHHYPNHMFIDMHINDILDNHNMHFHHYLYNMKHSNSVSEEEKIIYLVKCAAWLFCRVITLHPFRNGNGRLCRILANDVLMEIAPFPVLMYNFGSVTKDTYFNAIIQYQGDAAPKPGPDNPNTSNDPEHISALLVEALWHGWKEYKKVSTERIAQQMPDTYISMLI